MRISDCSSDVCSSDLLADPGQARAAQSTPYWTLADAVASGLRQPFEGTPSEAVDALEQQLSLSVRGQMLSHVPLGDFLSGRTEETRVGKEGVITCRIR